MIRLVERVQGVAAVGTRLFVLSTARVDLLEESVQTYARTVGHV